MKHTNQSLMKNMMDKNFLIWPTPNSGVIKKEKKKTRGFDVTYII
jgi:hypothetical protein